MKKVKNKLDLYYVYHIQGIYKSVADVFTSTIEAIRERNDKKYTYFDIDLRYNTSLDETDLRYLFEDFNNWLTWHYVVKDQPDSDIRISKCGLTTFKYNARTGLLRTTLEFLDDPTVYILRIKNPSDESIDFEYNTLTFKHINEFIMDLRQKKIDLANS